MKSDKPPRFDIDAWRRFAGETVFGRGADYHRKGQVTILRLEPHRIVAQVSGTEDYRTELTGTGKQTDGSCTCRAFEDNGFCKHMVAVALAANDAGKDGQGAGALDRIRAHLEAKGTDALVDLVLTLAERDSRLFRKLDREAAALNADDKTLKAALRKAIDTATHTRGFIEYADAGGWATEVEEALDTLAEIASGPRAGVALGLAEQAIDRIEAAMEHMDDSDGHGTGLLERARDIHLAAARAARPDPVALAEDLFARELEGAYDTFSGAMQLYADVLGEAGLFEYRRLAEEAWAKLSPRAGPTARPEAAMLPYDALAEILDFFAERDGDLETRIALRAKDLSTPWDYLQLAEFCRAHGREKEALDRVEEGLWLFEDGRPDERLLFFAIDLLTKAGRTEDATAHLWRAFEKLPSLTLYGRLAAVGGGDRAIAMLEKRLAEGKPAKWGHPADLLVQILLGEKRFEACWEVGRRHGASLTIREQLARASETTHPREAVDFYAERIEQLASAGGNRAYEGVAELLTRMAKLRGPAEHAAHVAALKERHGRKRKLMQLIG